MPQSFRGRMLFIMLMLAAPLAAHAALVNINTADAAALDTLPHIGPALADRIIAYREANGPFAAVEDLQKVSGIGSGSNWADIAPLITVGDAGTADAPVATDTASTSPEVAASAPPPEISPGNAAPYRLPAALSVSVGADRQATREVPLRLSAKVKNERGAVDTLADISWSFGDGSAAAGAIVEKTFHYAGTYLVRATAKDGDAIADDDLAVVVADAQPRVVDISGEGITLANDADAELDLSGWRLTAGLGSFLLPEGTALLPKARVLFPRAITHLPLAPEASLFYPNSSLAARYAPPAASSTPQAVAPAHPSPKATEGTAHPSPRATEGTAHPSPRATEGAAQPLAPKAGLEESQTVNAAITGSVHEVQTARAPAAAAKPAAAGAPARAAEAGAAAVISAPPAKSAAPVLARSPWTYGFLGLLTLVGGALLVF